MEEIVVNALCAALAALGLGVAVWVVATGQLATEGVDSLFLVAVALIVAAAFARIPIEALRRSRKRAAPASDKAKATAAEERKVA